MAARSTIIDVARAAGVSVGTVSNYLNRPEVVAVGTANRIASAIAATGFVHRAAAAQMRGGRSGLVGVVVPDLTNPFWSSVVAEAERVLEAAGSAMIVMTSHLDPVRERRAIEGLRRHGVDALMVASAGRLQEVRRWCGDTPLVLVDRDGRRAKLSSVAVDDQRGMDVALRHLLGLGHRSVWFVNGPHSLSWCRERAAGVRRAVARHRDEQLSVEEVIVEELTSVGCASLVGQLLVDRSRTAIMCANDLGAIGVLHGLVRLGVRVPEQMSVIGYDDIALASSIDPPLTTVRQDPWRIGRRAAELIVGSEGDEGVVCEVIRPTLIVRGSTAPVRPVAG